MTPPSPNFARADRIDCIERFSTGTVNRVRSTSRAKEATDVRCIPVQILEIVWETRRAESGDLGMKRKKILSSKIIKRNWAFLCFRVLFCFPVCASDERVGRKLLEYEEICC